MRGNCAARVHTAVRRIGLASLCLIVLSLIDVRLWGQVSSAQSFVTRGDRSRNVLRVDTDLVQPGGNAYATATVKISTTTATPADRNLTVVLSSKTWNSQSQLHMAHRKSVTLAEGTSQIVVDLPHMVYDGQSSWDVDLYENGRDIEDRRGIKAFNSLSYQWSYRQNDQYAQIGVLIGSNDSDVKIRADVQSLTGNALEQAATVIHFQDASTDWRSLLGSSPWLVSAENFQLLQAEAPSVSEALRTYITAGGTLVVYSADFAVAIENIKKFLSTVEGGPKVSEGRPGTAPRNDSVQSLEYMLGQVLVTTQPLEELPMEIVDRIRQQKMVSNERAAAIQNTHDGDWFWRNMILAVGKPPVWSFCVLVTVFGAVLGPGLLVFTGRMQRRSLMILLVPSISLVATLSILTYGILYEGFDTYTRTTSVQFIDQDGRGFAWYRQNFFSGLPPRDGLVFDTDTFVRPVNEPDDYQYYGNSDPHNAPCIVELDDQQRWLGWLQPRQQQQLLVGHTLSQAVLPVRLERFGSDGLTIENLTEGALPLVVARGSGDLYYCVGPVAAGASVVAEPMDRLSAGAMASRLSIEFRPEVPEELRGSANTLRFGMGGRSGRMGNRETDIIHSAFIDYLSDRLFLPENGVAVVALETDQLERPLIGNASDEMHLIVGVRSW